MILTTSSSFYERHPSYCLSANRYSVIHQCVWWRFCLRLISVVLSPQQTPSMHVLCCSLDDCGIRNDGMMALAKALAHCPKVEQLGWVSICWIINAIFVHWCTICWIHLYTLVYFCRYRNGSSKCLRKLRILVVMFHYHYSRFVYILIYWMYYICCSI